MGKIHAMPNYVQRKMLGLETDKDDDSSLDGSISGWVRILPHIVSKRCISVLMAVT